ncbi:MAG: UDP-N-acetylmuramate dehydrogenase [Candidatus Gracilibacteria bacterium]
MNFEKIKSRFPRICKKEPLKNHCTFRIGGPADLFYELTNIEELPELLTFAEENSVPYRMVGRGTNVLFTDKGFRGLIIKNLANNYSIDGEKVVAESGVILAQLVRASVDANLTGLETFYGLPGSIGGAIYGNAGTPGNEIGKLVENITVFSIDDGIQEFKKDDLIFEYRHSSLQKSDKIILSVELRLQKGDKIKSKELLKQIEEIRRGKQPIGWSAGSFFKNPSKEKAAGYLIDQVGLKGFSVGDAVISEQHGNFFMNKGNATFADMMSLAKKAKQKVKEKFDIELEMEVKIIGDL